VNVEETQETQQAAAATASTEAQATPAPVDLGGSQAAESTRADPFGKSIQDRLADAKSADAKVGLDGKPVRGADGKFAVKAAEAAGGVAEPEDKVEQKAPAAPSPELEHATARVAELEARDSKWQETAEAVLAKYGAMQAKLQRYEAYLKQHNIEIDPRDLEIVQLTEKVRASELSGERQRAMDEQRAEQAAQAKAAQREQAVVQEARQLISQYPALNPNTPATPAARQTLVQFWTLFREGKVAASLAPMFVQAIQAAGQAAQKQQPPKLLGGGGTGRPKPASPQDVIADFKARHTAA
jgi:hypothetical protein